MRFGDRVCFRLNIENNLPNILLPGMLLQPLIENAVIHGVASMTDDATVIVSIEAIEAGVKLTVEDNGQGISSERLEWLMNDDFKKQKQDLNSHIGLLNAKYRVEMMYGQQVQFHIDSLEDVGTIVSIIIQGDCLPVVGEEG